MKQKLLLKTMLLLCALIVGSSSVWATDVTYTISSTSVVTTTSGTAPTKSSASFANTYTSNKFQMTGGNSQTLTLSGYNGYKITNITLSMHSNKSSGAGKLSYSADGGTTYTYIVGSSESGLKFNDDNWYGAWSQTDFVDVSKNVNISGTQANIIIKIEATENSLFCQSFKITYESYDVPKQPYYLVNNANQLADGDKIIIVSGTKALSTTQNDNNRAATDITKEADESILLATDANVQVLTLEKTTKDNNIVWYLNAGTGYLYASSGSSNNLKTSTKNTAGDNGIAAITFTDDNASIIFQGNNGRNDIRYNPNNGSPIFSCYASTSTMAAVQIYKATTAITLAEACTDGEGKYYGTFSSSKAFIVPASITVSEIKVQQGKLNISDYTTGDVVPANTGVMISSNSHGAHTVYFSNASGTSKLGEENMLKPSGDNGIDADHMYVADTKFYRLTMHNASTNSPGVIGFWWGAANGVSFNLAANKAYLAVPTSAGAPAQGFGFGDETTGINAALTDSVNDNVIYDLSGRRVTNPTKGLYIMNGKKFFVK